jgi:dienelactone hydrolase
LVHGLTGTARDYHGHASELASHGYLVFVPDIISGDGPYTKLSDGTEIWFNTDLKKPGATYDDELVNTFNPVYQSRVD